MVNYTIAMTVSVVCAFSPFHARKKPPLAFTSGRLDAKIQFFFESRHLVLVLVLLVLSRRQEPLLVLASAAVDRRTTRSTNKEARG